MERSTRSINAVGIPVSSGRGGCQFSTSPRLMYFTSKCRVPDDWLLKNKRPLLHGREVLREVLATWQARAKELPC